MRFKHYATDEIIEVKILVTTTSETIIEMPDGKMAVVAKDPKNRYQIKGTSFFKID